MIHKARHGLLMTTVRIILTKYQQAKEKEMSNKVTEWASAAQLRYIDSLNDELGFNRLDNYDISKDDASHLIDRLKSFKEERIKLIQAEAAAREEQEQAVSRGRILSDEPSIQNLPKSSPTKIAAPLRWLYQLKTMLESRQLMPCLGEINRVIKEAEARGVVQDGE